MLSPTMFASLTVQWLPLLTQRVARKVDKINHVARDGLNDTWKNLLEKVQEQAAATPGLETFASPISEALRSGNGQRRLGEAILELLKALRGLSFEVQTRFCERIAASLLPFLEDVTRAWTGDECSSAGASNAWQHHFGVKCEGCQVNPIVGPRFKCPMCPSYDLCGNCYPQKIQLHGNCPGSRKDFQCLIFPGKEARRGSKGGPEKCEATAPAPPCADWQGWAGKGGGPLGLMASMAGFGQSLGEGAFPFHPLAAAACSLPFAGMAFSSADNSQEMNWADPPPMPWGKGKGKKGGKKGKKWWHHLEEKSANEHGELASMRADDEFEKKFATLRELRLGSDEVIRELLVACDGDVSRVVRMLVHDNEN